MEPLKITLTLPLETVNLILTGLAELPFKSVYQTIEQIGAVSREQVTAYEKTMKDAAIKAELQKITDAKDAADIGIVETVKD